MTLTLFQREGRKQRVAAEHVARGGCCCACGAVENLEWHHRDPTKKRATIAYLLSTGTVMQLVTELEKCELLCHGCHTRLHRAYRRGMRPLVTRVHIVAWLAKDRNRKQLTHA